MSNISELFSASAGLHGAAILEEELVGVARTPQWLGDYVSVETLTVDAAHHVIAVTDKLPLADRFRETGFVFPSLLPDRDRAEVEQLTIAALDALGVTCGVSHTEIKLTGNGPRIIEVNGRLGGSIQRLTARLFDTSAVSLAISAALGDPVVPNRARSGSDGFVATVFNVPPLSSGTVQGLASPDGLRELAGVWRVATHVHLGDSVAVAAGSLSRLQTVDVEADGPEVLARRVKAVRTAFAEQTVIEANY